MPTVIIDALAPAVAPAEAYDRISEFARYPELTATVENVVVHPPSPDGSVLSEWTVHFRNGLLKWTERDTFAPEQLSLGFEQVTGDFATFRGTWRVTADGGGTLVRFEAEFDLGIPTLAAILEPVAEAALRDNILKILAGLLGEVQETVTEDRAVTAGAAQP